MWFRVFRFQDPGANGAWPKGAKDAPDKPMAEA